MSEQKQQTEAADGQSRLTAGLGKCDAPSIIGGYTISPSDDDLLESLRQRGYDPVFRESLESQLPAPEQVLLRQDQQERDG
ncbi:MAG: hypothetical protein KJ889_09705 [Gammaproteobacteria bacterium]|nr:hypothetical protein [Gammaproteobacteria bacterium]